MASQQNTTASSSALLVPATDGSLLVHSGEALHALPYTAPELVQVSPVNDGRGTAFLGNTKSHLLGIHVSTGHLVQHLSVHGPEEATCSSRSGGPPGAGPCDGQGDILWLKRRDHSIRAVELPSSASGSAVDIWNVSVGQLLFDDVHVHVPTGSCAGHSHWQGMQACAAWAMVEPLPLFSATTQGTLMASHALSGHLLWSLRLGSPVVDVRAFAVCSGRHTGGPRLLPIASKAGIDWEGARLQGSYPVLQRLRVSQLWPGEEEQEAAGRVPPTGADVFIGHEATPSGPSLYALPRGGQEDVPGQPLSRVVAQWAPPPLALGVSTDAALRAAAVPTCAAEEEQALPAALLDFNNAGEAQVCEEQVPALQPVVQPAPRCGSGVGAAACISGVYSAAAGFMRSAPGGLPARPGIAPPPIPAMPDVQVPLPPGHLLPQPGNPWDPQWGPASPPRRPDTAHRRSLTPGSSSPTSGSTAPRLELGNLSTSLVHLPVTPTAPLPGAPLQPIKVDASPVMEQPVVLADHRGRPLAVYLWTTRRTPVLSPHGHAVLEQKADGSFVPQTVVIAGERYLGGRQGSRVDVVFSKDFEADFLTRTVSAVWDGEDAEPVPTPARSPRSEVGFAGHAELDLLVSHLTSRYGGVTTISAPPHIQALLEWGWPASTLGLQLAADTVRQRMSHHMRSLFPEVNLNLQPAAGWATWQVVLAALAAAASVGVLGLGLWVAQRRNGEGQREGAGGPPPLPPIHVADKPARLPSVPASPVQPASPEEVEVDGAVFRKLGQQGLLVGQAILGKGSHGTVVLDGRLRSRPVAVKRMLRSFYDLAQREVDLLIRSDGHPNIVRYFACAEESDFVFLALERCECTLAQALQGVAQRRAGLARRVRGLLQPTGRRRRGGTRGKGRSVGPMPGENSFDALWVDDGEDSDGGGQATGRAQPAHPGAVQDDPAAWLPVPLPSDGSRMFLHSLVSGMAHLHSSCRIVHRDLKPGNVLLARAHRPARVVEAEGAPGGTHSKSVKHGRVPLWTAECGAWGGRWVPKISDMGLGKQLHGGSSITDPARRRSQATGSGDSSGHLRMGRGAGDASTDTAGVAGTVGWQAPELLAQIFGQSPGTLASSGAPSLPLAVGEPETSVQWDRLRPMQVVAAWAASDADWLPAMPVHLLPEGSLGSAEAQQAASQIQTEGTDDAGVDGPGQKRAVDVWAMGCMLYAVVDAAGHPFGPVLSRQERVLRGQHDLSRIAHLPELGHLLRGMLATRPSQRPRSVEVLEHPFFWSDARRCAFLQEVSDRLDREGAQCPAVAALDALTPAVCGGRGGAAGWGRRLPAPLLADATARRSYDFSRLSELLRLFRNQRHHFRELSRASLDAIVRGAGLAQSASSSLQSQDVPTALLRFFTAPPRFPRLLMAAYAVATWYFAHEPEFVALLGPRTTAKWGVLAQLQYVPSAPASPAREGGMPATPAPAPATPKRTPKRQTLTSKPAATPPTQRPLAAAATPKPASTPQPWLLPQAEWLAAAASSSQAARDERLWISRSGDVDGGGQPLRGASVVYEGGLAVRAGDGAPVTPVVCAWGGAPGPSRGLHLTTRFKGGGNTGGARYKAAVCSDWANKAGLCRRGIRCDFAHGKVEVTRRAPALLPHSAGAWEAALQAELAQLK